VPIEASDQAAAPQCPICGKQVERKPSPFGGFWWPCTAYPTCKGKLSDVEVLDFAAESREREVFLGLRAPEPNREFLQFEGVAAPRALVRWLGLRDSTEWSRAMGQWCLELPRRQRSEIPSWLAGALKLLLRGRVIPAHEVVVNECKLLSSCKELPRAGEWQRVVGAGLATHHTPVATAVRVDDSDEERQFLEQIAANKTLKPLLDWIIPQASLAALTKRDVDAASQQRVDFVFAHPALPYGTHVVEIDGLQHGASTQADSERDRAIRSQRHTVQRIPAAWIRDGSWQERGEVVSQLQALLPPPVGGVPGEAETLLALVRWAHQIQVTAIVYLARRPELIEGGHARVRIALPDKLGERAAEYAQVVLGDLEHQISALASIHGAPEEALSLEAVLESEDFLVSVGGAAAAGAESCIVRDIYFPSPLATEVILPHRQAMKMHSDRSAVKQLLTRVFGHEDFHPGQFEAIARGIEGLDSIVLLPTGAGKSAIYQLVSLLRPGYGLIIEPLVSLIEDQVENLRVAGLDRVVRLTSRQSSDEKSRMQAMLTGGGALMCYVAPERLQKQEFRSALKAASQLIPCALVAVDEAHCISEWGHDFRPAYLQVADTCRSICEHEGVLPPVVGLTGTASYSVLKDLQRELRIPDFAAIIRPGTFKRDELTFRVVQTTGEQRFGALQDALAFLPSFFRRSRWELTNGDGEDRFCGVVFSPHAGSGSPLGLMNVRGEVQRLWPEASLRLYSSTPASKGANHAEWQTQCREAARAFKRNDVNIILSTKAFGMGIDKPNIRFTIHLGLPGSIESLYQEAGRAGRDRGRSLCQVISAIDDVDGVERALAPARPIEEMTPKYNKAQDDLGVNLYFHTKNFPGHDREIQQARQVVRGLGEPVGVVSRRIAFDAARMPDDDRDESVRNTTEKALYRLQILGYIGGYTIDWGTKQFDVRLLGPDNNRVLEALVERLGSYQRRLAETARAEFARTTGEVSYPKFCDRVLTRLIAFIYDVVEQGRRRAFREVVALSRLGHDSARIALMMDDYLKQTRFTARLEAIADDSALGLDLLAPLFADVASVLDAGEVRGQAARLLGDYADHPGLLIARAVAEIMVELPSTREFEDDLVAAQVTAASAERYSVDATRVLGVVAQLLQENRGGLRIPASTAWEILVRVSDEATETLQMLRRQGVEVRDLGDAIAVLVGRTTERVKKLIG